MYRHYISCLFFIEILINLATTRVVNISDTWMLPEEGFSVFYRYFRDKISWYEADAVCQFHHGNLVTADTSSQYDAIRAYLKELDVSENIWIGLSKTTSDPNFTWKNYRPLSGDGHWEQSEPLSSDAICVAMDPSADFLWKSTACGGPETFSFICEMPVPSWAGDCLLTEIPSLTILYIPEETSVELTSDCGLDGTKMIICKGTTNREEMLKLLTCDDFNEKSTTKSSIQTTKSWISTSNSIEITANRQRRETENTISFSSSTPAYDEFNNNQTINENSTIKSENTTDDSANVLDNETSIVKVDLSNDTTINFELRNTTENLTDDDVIAFIDQNNGIKDVDKNDIDDIKFIDIDRNNETNFDEMFTDSQQGQFQQQKANRRRKLIQQQKKRPIYARIFGRVLG